MFYDIQINQDVSYLINNLSYTSYKSILSSPTVLRIKEFSIDLFQKIRSKLTNYDNRSNELNLKPVAMVMCLLLIVLFVLAFMRKDKEPVTVLPKPSEPIKEPAAVLPKPSEPTLEVHT